LPGSYFRLEIPAQTQQAHAVKSLILFFWKKDDVFSPTSLSICCMNSGKKSAASRPIISIISKLVLAHYFKIGT
jgi:hypothetical protein